MKSLKVIIVLMLVVGFALPGWAGEYTIFGPKQFARGTGSPVTETVSFASPVTGPGFTLKVQNGDSQGSNKVSSARVDLNGEQIFGPAFFNQQTGSLQRIVSLGSSNAMSVNLAGAPGSVLTITITGEDNTPPQINISNPVHGSATGAESIDVTGTVMDDTPVNVIVNGIPAAVNGGTFTTAGIPLAVGQNTITATATDLGGNVSSFSITVIREIHPPEVVGMIKTDAEAAIIAATLTIGNISSAYSDTVPVGYVISQNPASSAWVAPGTAVDLVVSKGPAMVSVPNVAGMTRSDAGAALMAVNLQTGAITTSYSSTVLSGNVINQNPAANTLVAQGTAIALVVSDGPAPVAIPPDPATVAPPVDKTITTTVAASTAFLYTGDNPIQTGVAPSTIEVKRAAVLRGQVNDRDGNPLSGVTVTILHHPEFGQTLTRADGMFDMAVNGGGLLTVNYRKDGYMPVQRQVNAPWNDYAWLPDVVMLPFDQQVTTIDLASNAPVQIARGSVATDADGTRQATLFFSQGTSAQMLMPDGTTQPLTSLNVRASEYTIGPNGLKAMPADLPPTSAYTYAVELSADEAVSAGATQVTFNRPVYMYVENFLNFPVGGIVPVGYYDNRKMAWIPSENGRIVKILSITGGLADFDTDGSGLVADATKLAALGITDAERQQLASLYVPGQSLWRVPITHFTPYDCNWPWGPPPDAVSPNQPDPEQDLPIEDPCTQGGSIIECQNQTLGESVTVIGTPFSLNYRSNRVPGRKSNQTIKIPLSSATVPASLQGIVLTVDVAGRKFIQNFPAAPNLTYDFIWDGLDCYGRRLHGVQVAKIEIGYSYGLIRYTTVTAAAKAFDQVGGSDLAVNGRTSMTVWQMWEKAIEYQDAAESFGLGGWSLNVHHGYDSYHNKLYMGDGTGRIVEPKNAVGIINTFVKQTEIDLSEVLVFGPDGSIYGANNYDGTISRISPDGTITTIAGNPNIEGSFANGIPATAAALPGIKGIAVGPDGSIYLSCIIEPGGGYGQYHVVRKIGPDGIINTIMTSLDLPAGVALGRDGSLYIAEAYAGRIRRVGPDGIITTVAGMKQPYPYNFSSGDGGPATKAYISNPSSIAFGPDGSYYITEYVMNFRMYSSIFAKIRKVSPDGIITTVAGGNYLASPPLYGDYGPATNANIYTVDFDKGDILDVGPDGSIYISDIGHNKIRRISPSGLITTVAGSGQHTLINWEYTGVGGPGDGGPATSATFRGIIDGIAVSPDGSLYILDEGIRRVTFKPESLLDEFFIASEDGKAAYIFDGYGRHIRTVNALTNATLYQFGYDGKGLLTTVTDGDGNVTTIERDSAGNPVAIVAPFGQRTTLSLDMNGYIDSIIIPAGETTRMTYTADGLLTSFVDPKGNASRFFYDDEGYLTLDQNAAGGFSALSSTRSLNSSLVSLITALNRTTTYLTESLANGDQRRTITLPAGVQTIQSIGANGVEQDTAPDQTFTTTKRAPDPRFGMQAPLESTTINTPSGLAASLARSRSATLADPGNPLSLTKQTDTLTFNGRIYKAEFDAVLKQSTTTTPVGRRSVTLLDSQGRALSFTPDPILTLLTFTYDTRGKLIQAAQGSQRATLNYDLLGRVASRSDALGHTVQYGYDNADRLTQLFLPSGRSYGFAYDANGNRTQITMPNGAVHKLGYTVINLGSDYTPPGNLPYAWQYSLDQEWTSTVLPGGRTVDASYDTGGRPTGIVYPEASVRLLYNDKTDRVSSLVRTPAGGGTAQQIAYTYDGSLVTGRTFSGVANGQFTYTYDNNFFLKQIKLMSGANTVTTPITRDADGLVTGYGPFTFTRNGPAGAVSNISGTGLAIAITYDSQGRPSSRTHTVSSKNIYSVQLSYDSTGNIVQKTETIPGLPAAWEYAYDADGQLSQAKKNGATEELFTYDVNGNRTKYEYPGPDGWVVAASFDEQERIIQQWQASYQFNPDGQMTQRGSDTFQYSAMGELLQATVTGQNVTYAYDGMGRRVARTDSTGTSQYLYGDLKNPFQLTAMRDPAGVLSTFYYDEAGLLFAMDKGGTRYYIAADQVGTPRVVSDSSGNVVKIAEWDSYGWHKFDTNIDFALPVGFAGGLADVKTGLVRFGYRDYEPATGRWTAKDPIFFKGGQGNLYGYVQNNPINYVDPYGLFGWDTVFKFIAKRASKSITNKLLGDGLEEGANFENQRLIDMGILKLKDPPPLPPGWEIDPDTGLLKRPDKPVCSTK